MYKIFLNACLALVILPCIAFAGTVTYDGTDISAYYGPISSIPTNNTTPPNEFDNNTYEGIQNDDRWYSQHENRSRDTYASQRFVIEIDESKSSVSQIAIKWKGYGYQEKRNGQVNKSGVALYIWDYTRSEYKSIANTGKTSEVITLTKNITDSVTDYISNSDNTITLLAVTNDKAKRNKYSIIGTGYISVGITAIPAPDISINDVSVAAGDSADFTVSLTHSYSTAITLYYETLPGSAKENKDYTPASGTITIAQGDTSATVSIPTSLAGSGNFTLTLSKASAGTITDTSGTAEITALTGLIAEYRFEQDSWNGSVNEVSDNSDNNFHGQSSHGASTNNQSPALGGNPGTCRYADFEQRKAQSVGIPYNTELNPDGSFSVTFWARVDGKAGTWRSPITSRSENYVGTNLQGYNIYAGTDNRWQFWTGGERSGWDVLTGPTVNLRQWTHIAITFNASSTRGSIHTGTKTLYVDGVARSSKQGNYKANTNNPFYIGRGGNGASSPDYYFEGAVDEVRVYNGALSAEQIKAIKEETHACTASQIDHYEIIHDGSGLTCEAETVTVKACTNQICSTLSNKSISLDLQAKGSTLSHQTFTGSGQFSFNHTQAETLTLSVANPTVSAANALVCSGAKGASCDLTFVDSGFIFDIPTQTSCVTSPDITISAVRKDITTQQCVPGFSNVKKTLKFWTRYSDPTTGTKQATLTQNATGYLLATSEGTSVPVAFDANGEAVFKLNYPDAGQLTLNASYDGSGSDAGLKMTGSDLFVNVPAKLIMASNDANAACTDKDFYKCSAFKAAGANFNLSVSAACNDDNDTVTPNFQMNNIPLSVKTIAPDLGNPVSLGVNSINIANADKGIHTISNQTVSEVGVFSITATPPAKSYFGVTVPAATSANIGRFTPDHFTLSSSNVTYASGDMSYMNQPNIQLNYRLEAQNTNNVITKNYHGDFAKATVRIQAENSNDGIDLSNRLSGNTPSWDKGVYSAVNDVWTFSRLAAVKDGPYEKLLIAIKAIDSEDGINDVLLKGLDINVDVANDCANDENCSAKKLANTESIVRFGRWVMKNAYGPETLPLRIPMQVQYWDGSDFITNDKDSFTPFDSKDVSIKKTDLTEVQKVSRSGNFINGKTQVLTLKAPGAGKRGSVELEYTAPAWLKFDWDNIDGLKDGLLFDDNPSAQATFGLYRGNDRIIYRRESFQ